MMLRHFYQQACFFPTQKLLMSTKLCGCKENPAHRMKTGACYFKLSSADPCQVAGVLC